MKGKIFRVLVLTIFCSIVLSFSLSRVFGANTDYVNEDQEEEKGIGLAVIESEGTDVKSYFYLFYDDKGEVHTVQYMLNEMWSDKKENTGGKIKEDDIRNKKYILKTDADNFKAKELGAKEYYNSEAELEADKNNEATELYNKIAKEVGNTKTLYDYIEGTDDNLEPYTIESIIFNEVPIFDVNVFSEKAGGKDIKDDSPIAIIRKLVAIWFVSFRNVTLVVLVILIMYYGMRIAISTIASDRALYKEMLLAWLKTLILTLFVHIIMYLIFTFNETLVDTFKHVNEEEGSIYNTIKTRALEVPWKISIPAVILYLTLLVMWVRFIWTYFKRLFTVMFLIILAPIVLARYAIQSASGRGSQLVSNWIQKFATAVLIQSVHAMLYVAFVENALKVALTDLHGFFIALFFLNFILSADSIFANIFKFEFNPDDIAEMGKPFRPKAQLAGAYLTYGITKRFIGTVDGTVAGAGRAVKNTAYAGYLKATDVYDRANGGNSREKIEQTINKRLDKIDDAFINLRFDENGNPIEEKGIQGTLNEIFTLRKMSRAKGMDGATAKRILRLKKNAEVRKLKGNFKIIKDIGQGTVETIFAIPVGVQNPAAGIGLITDGPTRLTGTKKSLRRMQEKERKHNKKLDSVVKSFMITGHNQDIIEEEIENLTEEEKVLAIHQMRQINEYNINTYHIVSRINEIMEANDIEVLDGSTIGLVVDEVINGISDELTEDDKRRIKETTIEILHQGIFESEVGNRNKSTEQEARESTEREQTRLKNGAIPTADDTSNTADSGDTTDSSATIDSGDTTSDTTSTSTWGTSPMDDSVVGRAMENEQDRDTERDESDEETKEKKKNNRKGEDEEDEEEKKRITFNWGEVAEAIEEAVIEEKVDNKFANMARAVNNIKNQNMKEANDEDSEGEVVNINRFLDSL